jgi:hypothetical protein
VFDTVEGHIAEGRARVRLRTRADDLLLAATWCEAYELDPDDSHGQEMLDSFATAAAFLRRQAARRRS